jgi:hypothetical protein
MRLFGGIDQQEEERERARGHGALLYAQPVDPAEQLL